MRRKTVLGSIAATILASAATVVGMGALSPANAATSHHLMINPPNNVYSFQLYEDGRYGECVIVKAEEWNSTGLQVTEGVRYPVVGYSDLSCRIPENSGGILVEQGHTLQNYWYHWR
jgi:hypothetical protein